MVGRIEGDWTAVVPKDLRDPLTGDGAADYNSGLMLLEFDWYDLARPRFQLAAEVLMRGDVTGRIDQTNLGRSQQQVGYCLLMVGKDDEAVRWLDDAIKALGRGDSEGRKDNANLSWCLMRSAVIWRVRGTM